MLFASGQQVRASQRRYLTVRLQKQTLLYLRSSNLNRYYYPRRPLRILSYYQYENGYFSYAPGVTTALEGAALILGVDSKSGRNFVVYCGECATRRTQSGLPKRVPKQWVRVVRIIVDTTNPLAMQTLLNMVTIIKGRHDYADSEVEFDGNVGSDDENYQDGWPKCIEFRDHIVCDGQTLMVSPEARALFAEADCIAGRDRNTGSEITLFGFAQLYLRMGYLLVTPSAPKLAEPVRCRILIIRLDVESSELGILLSAVEELKGPHEYDSCIRIGHSNEVDDPHSSYPPTSQNGGEGSLGSL